MTMTIAADPGAALLAYLDRLGPAAARWLAVFASAGEASPAVQFWAVTIGSTLGMVVADAIAILIGRVLGRRLPERVLRQVSGAVFILFGVLTIASTFLD